jgi:hypothetical protein
VLPQTLTGWNPLGWISRSLTDEWTSIGALPRQRCWAGQACGAGVGAVPAPIVHIYRGEMTQLFLTTSRSGTVDVLTARGR